MEHIWWVQVGRGRGGGAHGTSKPKVGDGGDHDRRDTPSHAAPFDHQGVCHNYRKQPFDFVLKLVVYRIKVDLQQNFVSSCGN